MWFFFGILSIIACAYTGFKAFQNYDNKPFILLSILAAVFLVVGIFCFDQSKERSLEDDDDDVDDGSVDDD